ncbi:uncharacterized protein LOC136072230 [Hydra vulgaris]|uniref:uncharacterized protein LOC136072230 n=1 Tax=Hydra vulgaris TaxID=6087 RepID=UPI0032E9E992
MHHLFSNSLIRRVEVFVRITIKAKDTRLEKLDEKENKILMEMQTDQGGYVPEKIIPPAHIYMCVGAGLNILSDELKPSRLFEVDENDTYNSFGIQLPKGFQLVFVNETRKFSEYSKNQTEYVKKRLACLHFDANVDLSLFKMKTRAGFVYSSNLSNEKNSINHSLLQEVRLFKVEIKESTELKLTNEFKKHVNLLPDKYNRYDSSNKSLYQSFFNRWGHFIVSSAYGGGSVEISQFTEDAKNFEESSTSSQFLLETSFDVLSGGDVLSDCGSNFSDSTRFSNISLKWNGGDSKFHILNFGESDLSSKWSRWRESLKTNPSILTTEMSLAYIYEYVGLVNQSKVQGCKNALNDILGIRDSIPETLSSNLKNYRTVSEDMSLVTIKPTVSKDISTVTNRQKIVEGEIAKSDDPKCFPEKALVYVKGHNSPITLNKLKVRDEALSLIRIHSS